MKVAIIGAGAAGCFAAANLSEMSPETEITVFEARHRALAKLSITGGGHCNLTNTFEEDIPLPKIYPRGSRLMSRLLHVFDSEDTCGWFESHSVKIEVHEEGRVFPKSMDAGEVVRSLLSEMSRGGVRLRCGCRVLAITPRRGGIEVTWTCGTNEHNANANRYENNRIIRNSSDIQECNECSKSNVSQECNECSKSNVTQERNARKRGEYKQVETDIFDKVLVTTGGNTGYDFLSQTNICMKKPCPSLFSFRLDDDIRSLSGTSVASVSVRLSGTAFKAFGPLLITDWGMSGPAILRLSSYAAEYLSETGYKATMLIGWLGPDVTERDALERISSMIAENPKRILSNLVPDGISGALWNYLVRRSGGDPGRMASEVGTKTCRRLASLLVGDSYSIVGRNRFRDEFVTCGGVDLCSISSSTLEAKTFPGLYFAGEVLDIDAITGGYNLQAAWTTGYVAAKAITSS